MATYRVVFTTGASTCVDVEAGSKEEALDKADEAFEPPQICAQCQGWGNDQGVELGDGWEVDEAYEA